MVDGGMAATTAPSLLIGYGRGSVEKDKDADDDRWSGPAETIDCYTTGFFRGRKKAALLNRV